MNRNKLRQHLSLKHGKKGEVFFFFFSLPYFPVSLAIGTCRDENWSKERLHSPIQP